MSRWAFLVVMLGIGIILGRHEFVFSDYTKEESMGNWYDAISNATLLCAWVTRDDPVVKQFAAKAPLTVMRPPTPCSSRATSSGRATTSRIRGR